MYDKRKGFKLQNNVPRAVSREELLFLFGDKPETRAIVDAIGAGAHMVYDGYRGKWNIHDAAGKLCFTQTDVPLGDSLEFS